MRSGPRRYSVPNREDHLMPRNLISERLGNSPCSNLACLILPGEETTGAGEGDGTFRPKSRLKRHGNFTRFQNERMGNGPETAVTKPSTPTFEARIFFPSTSPSSIFG